MKIEGMVLAHPYFWVRFVLDWAWRLVVLDEMSSLDHPSINLVAPEGATSLVELGWRRAMVLLAEQDPWFYRGRAYYEALKESAKEATVFESTGPEAVHGFHIAHPETELAKEVMGKLVDFIHPK